jgi:dUTP pyrophosphatase
MKVRFRKVHPDAKVPTYATEGAAGADLYAAPAWPITVNPGRRAKVQTGIAVEIPDGYEAQVRPRSGLADKHGVTVLNAPGTLDSDFRGEVCVLLVNLGSMPFVVNNGDRIAQLVIAPVTRATFEEAEDLSDSERGEGGWGSTGR